jgi:hypothetical protein
MSETHILIRLTYFPQNWEFGIALSKLWYFGEGVGSTNSVEDRGQREQGSGSSSPLVRGSAQFAN